jgi:hypothetical protein
MQNPKRASKITILEPKNDFDRMDEAFELFLD